MVGPVGAIAIAGTTQAVQTVATKLIIDRMDADWKISQEDGDAMVKRLAKLARSRATLGFNKNDFDRDSYAESPILTTVE